MRSGSRPLHGGEVEVEDPLEPEPARDSLVRDGRVEVAVADDQRAAGERGPDHLLDVLRASRRIEESLRPGHDVAAVQDEIADPLAELRAARLSRRDDVLALRLEARAEELGLGALPRAVEALERHEHRWPILRSTGTP